MQIIDELEPHKRGSYGGAIGYLGFNGDLDTAIHIRTVVVKDGMVHVQAGGGTVADAKPDYEYEESVHEGEGGLQRGRAGGEPAGVAMTAVLVIDNYDSFTYNLVQYLGELGAEVEVVRNDKAEVAELLERAPRPARDLARARARPARPGSRSRRRGRFPEAGIPTLGVCLGHQSLVEAFGGRTIRGEPIHGKDAEIEHDGTGVFAGLPRPAARRPLPLAGRRPRPSRTSSSCTATLGDVVMGVRHRELPAEGVQFHPESVLTPARQGHARELPRQDPARLAR